MALVVPGGFLDLYTASKRNNEIVNIIGVVVDVMPPTMSRGRDWVCTFSISDSAMDQYDDQGLKVRFFKPMESELPKIQGTGDVAILRGVKVNQWSGMTAAISNFTTTWTIFPESSIPEKSSSRPQLKLIKESRGQEPSSAEMEYAILLSNSKDRSSYVKVSVPSQISDISGTQGTSSDQIKPITRREKFSLVKDVQLDNFYDLVGQVVKIYPSLDYVELYITDYTSNPKLYSHQPNCPAEGDRDGDTFGYIDRNHTSKKWPGPFGNLTLTITLWPPHSSFARTDIKENDFVFLRNVRIKNSKESRFEGSLHTDRRYADRIDVSIIKDHRDDDRIKNVLRRKMEYMKNSKAQSEGVVDQSRPPKRKQEEEKPLSKGQKKRRRQQIENASKSNPHKTENANQNENRNPEAQPLPTSNKSDINKYSTFPHHS